VVCGLAYLSRASVDAEAMRVRLAALYTGGKDSHYAVVKALEQGYEVSVLVVARPAKQDSYMFHVPNTRWAYLHGLAMGVPVEFVDVSGEREVEVEELGGALRRIIREYGVDGVVTGAVASTYQKARIDRLAQRLGIIHVSPNWGRDQEQLLREEASTLRFMIVAVSTMGLGPGWLGRVIGPAEAEELIALSRRYGFSPVGEGGEFETYVVESPLFGGKRIEVRGSAKWVPAGWGVYEIEEARVVGT